MRNNKSIIAVIVAVVAILAVVGIAFGGKMTNMVKEKTMSPVDYYKQVEKSSIKEDKDKFLKYYEKNYKLIENKKMNSEANISVKVEDGLSELFASQGAEQLSSIKSADISFNYGMDDKNEGFDISSKINDTDFLSANAYYDSSNKAYAQVPAISDSYLDFSSMLETEEFAAIKDALATSTDAQKSVNPKNIDHLVTVYTDAIIDSVKNVTKENAKISAGKFEEDATLLTVTMSGTEFCDTAIKLCDTLKKDEVVKEIITVYADAYKDTSTEEFNYDEFVKSLDDAKKEIEDKKADYAEVKDMLVMKVYVNASGKIIGRDVTLKAKEDTISFKSLKATYKNEYGYTLSLSTDKEKELFSVVGNGKMKADTISGEFDITIGSEDDAKKAKATLKDCKTIDYLAGKSSGTVVLESNDLAPGYKLEVSFDNKGQDGTYSITVLEKDKKFATATITYAVNDKVKLNKPESNAEMIDGSSEEALANYVAGFDIEKFVNDFTAKAKIDLSYSDIQGLMGLMGGSLGGSKYDYGTGNYDISSDDYDFNSEDFNLDDYSTDDSYDGSTDMNLDDFNFEISETTENSGL
ncbi:MAG: hypothetical protein K6G88_03600 [Lachnospiraceae bacterium]|nr:hypothetical protein [Lachnospiraceae bacterium]